MFRKKHQCVYLPVAVSPATPEGGISMTGKEPLTAVLSRCTCGSIRSAVMAGRWELWQVQGKAADPAVDQMLTDPLGYVHTGGGQREEVTYFPPEGLAEALLQARERGAKKVTVEFVPTDPNLLAAFNGTLPEGDQHDERECRYCQLRPHVAHDWAMERAALYLPTGCCRSTGATHLTTCEAYPGRPRFDVMNHDPDGCEVCAAQQAPPHMQTFDIQARSVRVRRLPDGNLPEGTRWVHIEAMIGHPADEMAGVLLLAPSGTAPEDTHHWQTPGHTVGFTWGPDDQPAVAPDEMHALGSCLLCDQARAREGNATTLGELAELGDLEFVDAPAWLDGTHLGVLVDAADPALRTAAGPDQPQPTHRVLRRAADLMVWTPPKWFRFEYNGRKGGALEAAEPWGEGFVRGYLPADLGPDPADRAAILGLNQELLGYLEGTVQPGQSVFLGPQELAYLQGGVAALDLQLPGGGNAVQAHDTDGEMCGDGEHCGHCPPECRPAGA